MSRLLTRTNEHGTLTTQPDDTIMTWTGRIVRPLALRLEDIDIWDIAHALGMKCRYTGHCKQFYCPTPDSRILTADLRWIPCGDAQVGQQLFAFDEHPWQPGSAGTRRRRLRPATVTATSNQRMPTIRLRLSNGESLVASAEHPWLIATKQSRNQKWATAQEIATAIWAGQRRYLHKFLPTWKENPARWAGWLAGIWDGEGYLSTANRGGTQAGVSQRPGPVWDQIGRLMLHAGYNIRSSPAGDRDVLCAQLAGGWPEVLRFLGEIRPVRLLSAFASRLATNQFEKQLQTDSPLVEIVSAENAGVQDVVGMETTAHTYFCEGYGSHNSVAQHCVLMARWDDMPGPAVWRLLHDASEAYLPDIASPIKDQFPIIKAAEDHILGLIAQRFGLAPYGSVHAEVKKSDRWIMAWEGRNNMPDANHNACWWRLDVPDHVLDHNFHSWAPDKAAKAFISEARCLLPL